ncbi:GntR family transcriptional regulator [Agromyces sp. ISL-38]|uniref:GntR family transcriptional regulator n=1 Tax=Agromyces sp. ISL-38 TaxID=2819107 RepID=UPI001BE50A87|nr:GntR family transcriptional regulator [Agromyces sp. ISL-38]MBT2497941.1 GntR family transcriptional regulator [Agromyces sp. ISL-38]MBT2516984.1 GntR family transcriptional regulator [Streptomyces sp. ISL-90]
MPTTAAAPAQPAVAQTAVARVAAAVRADILSGALAPGSPLREESAAEHYAVSRHTVRAAFQRLVAERLAVAEPYRGVRVTSFDRDQVIALQQLRAALEVEAVRIAGERFGAEWPESALAPARDALGRLDAISAREARGEPVDWLEVERIHADFHRALVAASASPRIIETHTALGSELLLFLLHVRPHYTLGSLIAEHRALLDELPARGPSALREHLEHSTRLLVDG